MSDAITVQLGGLASHLGDATIDRYPDECAICGHGVTPKYMAGAFTRKPDLINRDGGSLQLVFQCPNAKCRAFYFGNYAGVPQAGPISESRFFLKNIGPKVPRLVTRFPAEIDQLSKRFIGVHWEAATAEAFKLTEVAGPGYRKALEILVKDFVIAQNPTKKASIEQVKLAQCINNYIDDSKVKACANRAAWLGNDETHYVRVWADKDMEDLKTLIQLTVNWIHSTLLTKKYTEEMPEKTDSKKIEKP